jgi:IS605 OrfB family transposase
MKLVQKHLIKKCSKHFVEIDKLAFLSKNLYNCALYLSRQAYFKGEKLPSMTDLHHQLKMGVDYKALPAKVSQLVLKQVEKTFKSFLAANKEYKKCPDKFTGKPKLPKYKDKLTGRNLLTYNYQAISKKLLKQGIINPSGTNLKIPTQLDKIAEVRIIPKLNSYCVEIVYEKLEIESNVNTNYAFIDLGLNNLAALTSNQLGFMPTLICGKALKSCNQKYNKTLAKLKSELPANQKTSKKIQGLTLKRNCKVDHYLHTASRYIVNLLVSQEISLLVIGQNEGWKQNINIGDKNNQNFVDIPHTRFINQLTYKCQLVGIEVIFVYKISYYISIDLE